MVICVSLTLARLTSRSSSYDCSAFVVRLSLFHFLDEEGNVRVQEVFREELVRGRAGAEIEGNRQRELTNGTLKRIILPLHGVA